MNLNETMRLTDFGVNILKYANEKSSIRYFVKKFNLANDLAENNNTGTIREVMTYATGNTRKEMKAWYKEKLQELLTGEEIEITRETYVVEAPVVATPRVAQESSPLTRSMIVEEETGHPEEFDETEVEGFMQNLMNGEE